MHFTQLTSKFSPLNPNQGFLPHYDVESCMIDSTLVPGVCKTAAVAALCSSRPLKPFVFRNYQLPPGVKSIFPGSSCSLVKPKSQIRNTHTPWTPRPEHLPTLQTPGAISKGTASHQILNNYLMVGGTSSLNLIYNPSTWSIDH